MKNISTKVFAGLVAGLCAAPGALLAADEPAALSASLDVPVLSAYVWRGQVLNDEAVVQPSMTVSKGGFTLNYWQNFALTDATTGDEFEFTEHDITLSYAFTCPLTGAGITLGLVNYDFPNQSIPSGDEHAEHISLVNDTREVYASVGFGEVLLKPSLSVYYDFKEADAFYATAGVSHSFALGEVASLDLGFSTGAGSSDYNAFYFGVDDDALNDGNVTAAVPFKPCEHVTLTPGVQYTWLWDSEIEDAAEGLYKDKDQFVASLKASYAF